MNEVTTWWCIIIPLYKSTYVHLHLSTLCNSANRWTKPATRQQGTTDWSFWCFHNELWWPLTAYAKVTEVFFYMKTHVAQSTAPRNTDTCRGSTVYWIRNTYLHATIDTCHYWWDILDLWTTGSKCSHFFLHYTAKTNSQVTKKAASSNIHFWHFCKPTINNQNPTADNQKVCNELSKWLIHSGLNAIKISNLEYCSSADGWLYGRATLTS